MIFGVWNPEKIWHQQLIHLTTLPLYCNHFTLGNQKCHFSTVIFIQTSDYYIISEETNCNCCTAVYLFTYVCLLLPIICIALFYGQFLSLWSVIFKATNASPQPALFRVTNIWRNATLPAVRCRSFTFYKVVWWHFSGVVGKGVTVCFFWDNINNLEVCMNNTVENDFFGFTKVKLLQYTGKVGKCTSYRCQIFSGFNTPKISKIG